MARFLGIKRRAMKDIKMTSASCGIVPIEKQFNRERIVGIFGSSRTISVAFDLIPEHIGEECMLLNSTRVQMKNEGGNIYFVMRTSMIKVQRRFSCHFGRNFLNGKSVHIVIGGGTLRKLIYSLAGGHGNFLVIRDPWNAAAVMVSALPCMRFLRPVTCLPNGSEEDSYSYSLPCSKWSSLPFLILWMIKERLDFFNNAKVALVCRHWWVGSKNNPSTKMQTVGDGMPWIMLNPSVEGNTRVREFTNFERTKKFAVDLPEFYKSSPLFSKRGWILLERKNFHTKDVMAVSFFLINPLTKDKIELGDIDDEWSCHTLAFCRGCFSTSQEGFPNCVVILCNEFRDDTETKLFITYPSGGGGGDQGWTEHSYADRRGACICMAVINYIAYFFYDQGSMLMCDMGGQTWKSIRTIKPVPIISECGYMEHEGNVVFFRWLDEERWLFKYSHTHNCWQRLSKYDDEATNNLSFFGSTCSTYLPIRLQRAGSNVYRIKPVIKEPGKEHALLHIDYFEGKSTSFKVSDDPEACWVDIG